MADRDADIQLLQVMRDAGADLTKPAHTIHYLYFKSLAAATVAAQELRDLGYSNLSVHPSPGDSWWKKLLGKRQYSCIAETHAVPSQANVFAATDRMEALAAKLGGDYDGWEASIEQ